MLVKRDTFSANSMREGCAQPGSKARASKYEGSRKQVRRFAQVNTKVGASEYKGSRAVALGNDIEFRAS